MKEMRLVQNWKVGSKVTPIETDFGITEGKVYEIIERYSFYDCFIIIDDSGKPQAYSEECFYLVVEEEEVK